MFPKQVVCFPISIKCVSIKCFKGLTVVTRRRRQITALMTKLRNPTYKIVDANWNVSVLSADADIELEE